MITSSRTTTVLLEGLRDVGNLQAWEGFDRRYRAIVEGFLRRVGLGEADAADAAQDTMVRFVREYRAGRYERERGRLRAWLIAMAKGRAAEHHRTERRRRIARGQSALDGLPDDASLTAAWDGEWKRAVLREAFTRLADRTRTSDRTMQAFELHVVRRMPVGAAAKQLDMTAQEVYLAKSRVAERLRHIVEEIEQEWSEPDSCHAQETARE